jgi:hypothetical protein
MRLSLSTFVLVGHAVSCLHSVTSVCRFCCLICLVHVLICSCCDRGNIYCPSCADARKQHRIRKARSRYRSTLRGRIIRSLGEQRRRARPRSRTPTFAEDSVGDRGSTVADHQVNSPFPGPDAQGKGGLNGSASGVLSPGWRPSLRRQALEGFVVCAFCRKVCGPLERQRPLGRRRRARHGGRGPPGPFLPNGGRP